LSYVARANELLASKEEIIVEPLRLPVLLGTNRKERKSVFAAEWLVGEMQKRD